MTDNECYAGPNARFLSAGAPVPGITRVRFGNALSLSFLTHLAGGLCILLLAGRLSSSHDTVANLLHDVPYHLALVAPEAEGGSGKQTPTPARQLQRPGQDAVAVPSKARSDATASDRTTPPDLIEVPAVTTTAGVQDLPGAITTISAADLSPSDGSGIGGHSGSGRGPGNGPGNGPGPGGLGEGYVVGNGVLAPRLIHEVKPGYTSDAMRARIQGTVRLQAIVSPEGSVSAARVIRSLDAVFGLDQEALKTVRQWRFAPGTLAGRAVPVLIEVELTFTLR